MAELRPVDRFEWERTLRRVRFDGAVKASAKTGKDGRATRGAMSGSLIKAIAFGISSYAGEKGDEIRPGDATVAVDVETSLVSVAKVRKLLIELGLLEQVVGPRGERGAEYRLTIPGDLGERLEVLTAERHRELAADLRKARHGRQRGTGGSPPEGIRRYPSMDEGGSAGSPLERGTAGSPLDQEGGTGGSRRGVPADAVTNHDQPDVSLRDTGDLGNGGGLFPVTEATGGPPPPMPTFEAFRDAYPGIVTPTKARKEWIKAVQKKDAGDIISRARSYAEYCDATGTYISNAENWLKEQCWAIDWEAEKTKRSRVQRRTAPNKARPYRNNGSASYAALLAGQDEED